MNNKTHIIGIAGAVGSGKSWFAEKLKDAITKPVCMFTMDSYSKSVDYVNKLKYRYDNPNAIDFDRAYSDLRTLLEGGAVRFPVYDYKSHKAISERTYTNPPVIIIEGLYAFYDKRFLDAMDVKIWIEADEEVCMERRISRDIKERGESREESMARHINDSEPAFQNYYKIGRIQADCIFLNQTSNALPVLIKMIRNYIH